MRAKTVIIVGGVAGGASCAARLRRQDEYANIIMFEKGKFVSYANCGLPFYVGDVIQEEQNLLVATIELFRQRFNIDARTEHEVIAIDRQARTVTVRRLDTGEEYEEAYDMLVLAPGAVPIQPPLPGIDLPGVFTIRTVPDAREVRLWLEQHQGKRAVVVGGGFIGLEMAENLRHRGLDVTIIEKDAQLMPPIDREMSFPLLDELRQADVRVELNDGVSAIIDQGGCLGIETERGLKLDTDLVIMAIGVRPDTGLARACGLRLGPRGHIVVDGNMRTSDRRILAVGDAIEVHSVVIDQRTALPLAGPANRQGRIAADVITHRGRFFRGIQGTAVCGVFGLTVANTGVNEKTLRQTSIDFDAVYAHPNDHVSYYPGATPIFIKLLFDKSSGKVLGAQAVGRKGVERRIDVIAMAIQMGATVFDLEEAELCYAPQYGAAKDPVNIVGMIAANVMRGDLLIVPWQDMHKDGCVVLDVREPNEVQCSPIEADIHIPLHELRSRLDELPREQTIHISCAMGARAYSAVRLLVQHGFDASLLSGGAETWFCVREERSWPASTAAS
ncbi:MAG TPA: FAD-dependent oxidoreductase [Candidatus Competibacteraceae bacterium]|nr:FAD-dependent oxidoreductase [Candidatus Competibacteraceae bacterium]